MSSVHNSASDMQHHRFASDGRYNVIMQKLSRCGMGRWRVLQARCRAASLLKHWRQTLVDTIQQTRPALPALHTTTT